MILHPSAKLSKRTTHDRKMTSCRFSKWRISVILVFRGPIIPSLKNTCTTFYRSSMETMIALNCVVFFEKIAFFFHFDDRQTNRWTDSIKPLRLHASMMSICLSVCVRFSTYFIFFMFLMQFRLWRAATFVSSPIHLFQMQPQWLKRYNALHS